MKNIYFLLIALLFVLLPASAQQRSEELMLTLAQKQLMTGRNTSHAKNNNKHVSSIVHKFKDGEQFNIYGNNTGFTVISRDIRITPVLAYSSTDFSSLSDIPEGLQWWIDAMEESLKNKENMLDKGFDVSLNIGADIMMQRKKQNKATTVNALLNSQWGQGYPYNAFTPLINGEHAPTGCVATAMAQVIRYFQYPANGTGTGSYSVNSGTTRRSNIDGVYNYSLMDDTYPSLGVSEEKINAVSTLMRDCGYSAKMDYGSDGSAASGMTVALGLVKNFQYDSLAIRSNMRAFYTDEEWINILCDQIADGQPVIYGGNDSINAGHEFILDGYNEDGLFHINWGFDGAADGYYNIADLSPRVSGVDWHFNTYQEATYGFRTNPTPTADEVYVPNISENYGQSNGWTLSVLGKNLRCNYPSVFNQGPFVFYGDIGIVIEDTTKSSAKDRYHFFGFSSDNFSLPVGYYTSSDGEQVSFVRSNRLMSVGAGTYKAYFGAKSAYSNVPCVIREYLKGAKSYKITIAEDGTLTLFDPSSTTNGISNVPVRSNLDTNNSWYTIDGKNIIPSSNRHGIYIHNGKKFMKK